MEPKDEDYHEHDDEEDSKGNVVPFLKKPLYFWAKSFAEKEFEEDESFSNFVQSNALSYALEYIGITSENEQSSLHLSAIFDEDSQQQSRNKYPTHYESETKSRIQTLNRIFIELKSYFEDHFSQLVAIRPPNSVHIASACYHCSVKELEKLLFLLLGAAIQGTQKQDTIQKIKRFPTEIQEALIECIKLIADNPELIHVKSWTEFTAGDLEDQQKIYEHLLSLIRRLISERNESIQTQLLSDYFAGYMNCDQKRIYEGKNYGPESDFEKYSDDARLSAALRQLREELHEKSELLQECREELEMAKSRVQELENEISETQQKLRSCKKARDELDALREGQDKASRLEAELQKMKMKLEETETIYERFETLETENRHLQLKHDILMDQISFLSIEKQGHDSSFDISPHHNGHFIEDDDDDFDLNEKSRILKYTGKLFDSDDESSVKQKVPTETRSAESQTEEFQPELDKEGDQEKQQEEENEKETHVSTCNEEDASPVPETLPTPESPKLSNQPSTATQNRTKRRRRRSSVLNIKRTRRAIFIPIRLGQRLVPISSTERLTDSGFLKSPTETGSPTVKLFKVYNVEKSNSRRKYYGRPKRTKSFTRRLSGDKQVVSNLDVGNDADEELSLSPTGLPNESDIDDPEQNNQIENDSDIFFVCTATTAAGAPGRNNFGTVTSLTVGGGGGPVVTSNGMRHTVHHVNLNNNNINNNNNISSVHLPFLKISNGVNASVGQSDSDLEDPNDEIHLSDCNIQVNLRNKSVKPSTALINKISTFSTNLNLNLSNISDSHPLHNPESSSEDDDSVWYEYGCV